MRALLVCALAASIWSSGFAAAQGLPPAADGNGPPFAEEPPGPPSDPGAPPQVDLRAAPSSEPADLDTLFERLKREASPERAERIVTEIRTHWHRSGSATVDLLLEWAARAVRDGNPGAALDLFEQAMVLEPDYAEAWNARATLNFQLDEYGRSLADIEQTLRREPRHFGALAGLATILEELGEPEKALRAYRRILDIYPAFRTAQDAVARLTAEGRGQGL